MIRIPQPCHKKWNDLYGTIHTKYCSSCDKNVYNLDQKINNQIYDLMKTEGKVCGRITENKSYQNQFSVSIKNLFIFLFFTTNVFGQQDSIQIRGVVNDLNGMPIVDTKVSLKNFPIESFSNENGEFKLYVPKNLKTYILIAKESENQFEITYKEEDLSQELIIPLGNHEDVIIGEINYKPTFKQRVINTITWPYRKIRSTFFDN